MLIVCNWTPILIIFTIDLFHPTNTFGEYDDENENDRIFREMYRYMLESIEFNEMGDNGRVGIIGGSEEYSGAPYLSAISSLKNGAELVYVVTTREAAPTVQAYSADLLVYPFLDRNNLPKIVKLLNQTDILVIGPGLGQHEESLEVVSQIIESCKRNRIPLILDAEAIYVVTKNLTLIQNYPEPGIILTPNHQEFDILAKALSKQNIRLSNLGKFVSILKKGKVDQFFSNALHLQWIMPTGGSNRRVGGQGDILAGVMSILFHWSVKYSASKGDDKYQMGAAVASHAAAKIVRYSNKMAVRQFGRCMVATDMIPYLAEAICYVRNCHVDKYKYTGQ